MAGNKLRGKDFVLYVEKASKMVPVCCSRELSVSISADTIEATKAPQSVWRSYFYGNLQYSIATSGLISIGAGYGLSDLLDAQMSRTPLKFMARVDLGADVLLHGTVIVTSAEISGTYKDVMTFSFSGQGDGPLLRTKTLQSFPLIDGDGNTIVDGEGNTVVVAPDQYGNGVEIDINTEC